MKSSKNNKMITPKKPKKVLMILQLIRKESMKRKLKVNSTFSTRNDGLKVSFKENGDCISVNKLN